MKNIIRVEHDHLALLHYSGGHPVPRAESLYDGGTQIYANILVYVKLQLLLLPLILKTTKPRLICDPRPVKDSG